MFLGLRTATYATPDLLKAKTWYTEVLGFKPYFDQPYYVGYTVGGFELGLVPDAKPGVGGSIVYWGVADIYATLERLLRLGAVEADGVQDVGEGILLATVLDPFGNQLGIIQNPHFKAEPATGSLS